MTTPFLLPMHFLSGIQSVHDDWNTFELTGQKQVHKLSYLIYDLKSEFNVNCKIVVILSFFVARSIFIRMSQIHIDPKKFSSQTFSSKLHPILCFQIILWHFELKLKTKLIFYCSRTILRIANQYFTFLRHKLRVFIHPSKYSFRVLVQPFP